MRPTVRASTAARRSLLLLIAAILPAMAKWTGVDPDELHRRAQVAMLTGLARGDDVHDVIAAVEPTDVPGRFTPDVALLDLAVTALELACPPGAERLEYEGLRQRYLPEVTFRG